METYDTSSGVTHLYLSTGDVNGQEGNGGPGGGGPGR
jgi:hypothetical protein